MENDPLVTINILSYNRKDELRHTLRMVYDQDYKKIEVIVVDNASTDGTMEMVKSKYPEVRLIRLSQNIGISGWNAGFKVANGEFVMVLDDDSYPATSTIRKGILALQNESNLGIVAFEIYNSRLGKSETTNFDKRPKFFVGCGALIKKSLIRSIGLYNDSYFLYYHEIDYSARCYNSNFDIIYLPGIKVIHRQNLQSRGKVNEDPFFSSYRFYYYFISYSIFLIQNFDWKYSIIYLLKWAVNRCLVCMRHFYFYSFFHGVSHITSNFREIVKKRKPLKPEIQEFYNYGNIPLFDPEYF